MHWTPERLQEFEVLWCEPKVPLADLARLYGRSLRTIHRWRHEVGLMSRQAIRRLGPGARWKLALRETDCREAVLGMLTIARLRAAYGLSPGCSAIGGAWAGSGLP